MTLDPPRPRSDFEERANVISHAIGLALAIFGTVAIVAVALTQGRPLEAVTCGIFGLSAVATFGSSVVYHSRTDTAHRRLWLKLDYIAIYLLIAGTYTPLALTLLTPWIGWSLLAVEWVVALVGIGLVVSGREPSTLVYIALGAAGLAVLPALLHGIPAMGLALLALGGVSYIGGAGFYVAYALPFNHLIWHVAVMMGTALHYAAVFRYVALG